MIPRRAAMNDPTPWGLVLLLGSLTAIGPLAVDMYLPSLPAIARSLHASAGEVSVTLATFFVGLGVGQVVFGPLSDRLGRRGPLIVGVSLYLLGAVGCALAPSVGWLMAARLAQALGGAAGQAIARASVRDRFDHRNAARVLSLLMLVMGLAPIVAPLFGGYLLLVGDWRAIFWFQVAVSALILAATVLRLTESRPQEAREHARGEPVWRSYATVLAQPRVIGFALAGAFNTGAMFAWIGFSSYLLIEVYGVLPQNFGWWFGANAAGFIGMSQVNAHLLRWWTPEDVLVRARPVSILFALALVADAWTGFGGMLGVMIPLYLTIATFGLVGPNTQAAAMNVDVRRTGAISSVIGCSTYAMGAIVSTLGGYLHDGTARPLAALILALILLSSAALYLIAKPTVVQRVA
jgi:DHA1 family bicyclomycin/chloramphenicol resistance-like MFS transporter